MRKAGIRLEVPGKAAVQLTDLLLDFTGTLSLDGRLLPGVGARIRRLAKAVNISVATADTFATAGKALSRLPVRLMLVRTGADKATLVRRLGAAHVAAVGNGCNDVAMVRAAVLGIAVIGPEGASGELARTAKVVVCDIRDALDLLLNPLHLKATLRD